MQLTRCAWSLVSVARRAVVRRAERLVVKLAHDGDIQNDQVLAYLNRLSSLLFILARFEDREAGVTPTPAKES